jgi:hypothetical protein
MPGSDSREMSAAFVRNDGGAGARRHEMLYATYRNTCGRAREDLCQMLANDIRDARRLGATALADDLAVVLGRVASECDLATAPSRNADEHAATSRAA